MQRVAPHGVLPYRSGHAWFDDVVVERHHFALLVVEIVAVGVLHRHHAVFARSHAAYHEASAAVGARHAQQGFLTEWVNEVPLVVLRAEFPRVFVRGERLVEPVKSHEYALYGFEVLGIHHVAGNFQCVDMVAC